LYKHTAITLLCFTLPPAGIRIVPSGSRDVSFGIRGCSQVVYKSFDFYLLQKHLLDIIVFYPKDNKELLRC